MARFDLVAHLIDDFRRRADENNAFVFAALREGGILRQKTVPRMHRFGAASFTNIDDAVHREIALLRRRGANRVGIVGVFDVQRFAVGFGVDRHRFDIELAASARDPHRDLAPVGDQDTFKHVGAGVRPRQQATVSKLKACWDSSVASCLLPVAFFRAEYCHASSADCDLVYF